MKMLIPFLLLSCLLWAQDKQRIENEPRQELFKAPEIQNYVNCETFIGDHEKFIEETLLAIQEMPANARPAGVELDSWGVFTIKGSIRPDLLSIPRSIRFHVTSPGPEGPSQVRDDLLKRGFPSNELAFVGDSNFKKYVATPEQVSKEKAFEELGKKAHLLSYQEFQDAYRQREASYKELWEDEFKQFFRSFSEKAKRILISYAQEKDVNVIRTTTVGPPSAKKVKAIRDQVMRNAGVAQ